MTLNRTQIIILFSLMTGVLILVAIIVWNQFRIDNPQEEPSVGSIVTNIQEEFQDTVREDGVGRGA